MSTGLLDAPTTDEEALYEVINGEKVFKPMSTCENILAGILFAHVHAFCVDHKVGRATIETLFELPDLDRDRRPDVVFVSFAKWAAKRRPPSVNAWPVVPDLVAEVVSPTDDMVAVMEKVEEYFRAGVSLAWVVLPPQEKVYVYKSPMDVRILNRADELTGDNILPGFRLALSELFPPPDEA